MNEETTELLNKPWLSAAVEQLYEEVAAEEAKEMKTIVTIVLHAIHVDFIVPRWFLCHHHQVHPIIALKALYDKT